MSDIDLIPASGLSSAASLAPTDQVVASVNGESRRVPPGALLGWLGADLISAIIEYASPLRPAGDWDPTIGAFPANADLGTFYTATKTGTVDGVTFTIGDWLLPLVADAATDTYADQWVRVGYSEIVKKADGRAFDTIADAVADDLLVATQSIFIAGRLYNLVPASTYTANGYGIIDLTGSNLQAVLAERSASSESATSLDTLVIASEDAGADTASAVRDLWNDVAAPYHFAKLDRIQPEWGGAVGDGAVGNAAANIAALEACATYCAATNKVMLLPRGADYGFNGQIDLSAANGLVIEGRGAQFSFYGTDTSATSQLLTGAITADEFSLHLPTGNSTRRLISFRGETRIGDLIVTSVDQIDNRVATNDGAVKSEHTAGLVEIGRLVSENFDNVADFRGYDSTAGERVLRVLVQDMKLSSCVRGIHFDECREWRVEGGSAIGDSPNAAVAPGNNCLLSEGCGTGFASDVYAKNFGEHSFRAGTSPNSLVCESLKFVNLFSEGSGGSAVKLNDNNRIQSGSVIGLTAVDCGPEGGDLSNSMGVFAEKMESLFIGGLTVRAKNNTYSAYRGISSNGVTSKVIDGFSINKTSESGYFDKSDDGQINDTMVSSGMIWECVANGMQIEHGSDPARNYHIGSDVIIAQYDTGNTGTYWGIDWNTTVNATEVCSVAAKIESRGANAAGTHSLTGAGSGNVRDHVTAL